MGTLAPSHNRFRLTPSLGRSIGFDPGLSPTQRHLRHRAIHRLSGPVVTLQLIVLVQPVRPELLKDPGLAPLLKPQKGPWNYCKPRSRSTRSTDILCARRKKCHSWPAVLNRGALPTRSGRAPHVSATSAPSGPKPNLVAATIETA